MNFIMMLFYSTCYTCILTNAHLVTCCVLSVFVIMGNGISFCKGIGDEITPYNLLFTQEHKEYINLRSTEIQRF